MGHGGHDAARWYRRTTRASGCRANRISPSRVRSGSVPSCSHASANGITASPPSSQPRATFRWRAISFRYVMAPADRAGGSTGRPAVANAACARRVAHSRRYPPSSSSRNSSVTSMPPLRAEPCSRGRGGRRSMTPIVLPNGRRSRDSMPHARGDPHCDRPQGRRRYGRGRG